MRASKAMLGAGLALGLVLGLGAARADDVDERLVTVNFKEAPLVEVAALLSEETGVPVIAHRDVQSEMVTLSIKDRPLSAALQALSAAYDLKVELQAESGVYVIRRIDAKADGSRVVRLGSGAVTGATAVPVRPEVVLPPSVAPARTAPPSVRVSTGGTREPTYTMSPGTQAEPVQRYKIPLRFARPSDVAAMLGCPAWETSLTGRMVQYYPKLNVPRGEVSLGDTINRTDRYIRQANGRRYQYNPARVGDAVLYARDQFGEEPGGGGVGGVGGGVGGRTGGTGIGGGAGGGGVFELPEGVEELIGYDLISALIVRATEQGFRDLLSLVELLDVAPQQIEVESRFVTLGVDDAQGLGISWTLTDGTSTITGSTPSTGGSSVVFRTATGNFQAVINAIVSQNRGKLVSAPKVSTQNGQPASVSFQQEIPVVTSQTVTTQAATTTTPDITIFPVTIDLFVVPRVTGQPPDESITTVIQPTFSEITRFVDSPTAGQLPVISDQYVQTTLRVRNGETIALGGLIRKDNSVSSTGIPLLQDLPFIGGLFRSRTNQTRESELLIFVTPTIIREMTTGPGAVR